MGQLTSCLAEVPGIVTLAFVVSIVSGLALLQSSHGLLSCGVIPPLPLDPLSLDEPTLITNSMSLCAVLVDLFVLPPDLLEEGERPLHW